MEILGKTSLIWSLICIALVVIIIFSVEIEYKEPEHKAKVEDIDLILTKIEVDDKYICFAYRNRSISCLHKEK